MNHKKPKVHLDDAIHLGGEWLTIHLEKDSPNAGSKTTWIYPLEQTKEIIEDQTIVVSSRGFAKKLIQPF